MVGALLVTGAGFAIGMHFESVFAIVVYAGMGLLLSSMAGVVITTPYTGTQEEAGAEAGEVLTAAVKDRYEVEEVHTTPSSDWTDTAVKAVEADDFLAAPYVQVLTDDGLTARYRIVFDNKSGEATLYADAHVATSPKELLKKD